MKPLMLFNAGSRPKNNVFVLLLVQERLKQMCVPKLPKPSSIAIIYVFFALDVQQSSKTQVSCSIIAPQPKLKSCD